MSVDALLVGSAGETLNSNSVTSTGGTSSAGKFLICVEWFTNNSTDVINPTIIDSKLNIWTQVGTNQLLSNGDAGIALYKCETGTSGSAHTATASFKDGGGSPINTFSARIQLLEIPGAATPGIDVVVQGEDDTRPYTITSGTLAQTNEVVIALCICDTGESDTWTISGVTTKLDTVEDGNMTMCLAKVVVASTSSVTASFNRTTDVSDHHAIQFLVSFKQASAGGGNVTSINVSFASLNANVQFVSNSVFSLVHLSSINVNTSVSNTNTETITYASNTFTINTTSNVAVTANGASNITSYVVKMANSAVINITIPTVKIILS